MDVNFDVAAEGLGPSMKVPPKRKGNPAIMVPLNNIVGPQ